MKFIKFVRDKADISSYNILKKKKRRDEDEIDRTFQTWKADSVF